MRKKLNLASQELSYEHCKDHSKIVKTRACEPLLSRCDRPDRKNFVTKFWTKQIQFLIVIVIQIFLSFCDTFQVFSSELIFEAFQEMKLLTICRFFPGKQEIVTHID